LFSERLLARSSSMAVRGSYRAYRGQLTSRARTLRRNTTPAEKRLWILFLRDLPQKFTRQKPLGAYIADFYCASRALIVEIDGDSHFALGSTRYDVARMHHCENAAFAFSALPMRT
jgi:very-short-patch-repair endonuclease